MSKLLLHSFRSHVLVSALGEHAFVVVTSPEGTTSSIGQGAHIFELRPFLSSSPKTSGNNKDSSSNEKDTEIFDIGIDIDQKNSLSIDGKNDIQAVCSAKVESRILVAVSREDKTLSLYCISSNIFSQIPMQERFAVENLYPIAVYNMPKRSRCLAFTSFTNSSKNEECHTIVVGDLSGDAFSYPIQNGDTYIPKFEANAVVPRSKPRRLLLGHTASMLTGLRVVPASLPLQNQFVLTADRDEKVRVSFFPETHIIHGYLLGHSAFISTMDALTTSSDEKHSGENPTLCLTGSGDGTVRLWDYQNCREVGMIPVILQKCHQKETTDKQSKVDRKSEEESKKLEEKQNEDEKEDENEKVQHGSLDDNDDDYDESDSRLAVSVPLAVAISPNGEFIVVARDGITSIDIHPFPSPENMPSRNSLFSSHALSLHIKQTLACPSQPLGVCVLTDKSVLVLTREPEYLIHYQCFDRTGQLMFKDISDISPFSLALREVARSYDITMPMTNLERGENGELKLQKQVDNHFLSHNFADNGVVGSACENGNTGANGHSSDEVPKGVLHWNDVSRKKTYKMAAQRRRKRKWQKRKDDSHNTSVETG